MSDGHFVERGTLDLWDDTMRDQRNRIKELEAKLEKAKKSILSIKMRSSPHEDDNDKDRARQLRHIYSKARATLAELTAPQK